MSFTIGGKAVEAPPQPTMLSQDEADRAAVWLEKCVIALWRYEAVGERLRRRELWVQRNAGHPLWSERKQQVHDDIWEWHHAWQAFHEATERLDGVLHRWPEDQQQEWMEQEGLTGRTVLAPVAPQVIENTGWVNCRMYVEGAPPF